LPKQVLKDSSEQWPQFVLFGKGSFSSCDPTIFIFQRLFFYIKLPTRLVKFLYKKSYIYICQQISIHTRFHIHIVPVALDRFTLYILNYIWKQYYLCHYHYLNENNKSFFRLSLWIFTNWSFIILRQYAFYIWIMWDVHVWLGKNNNGMFRKNAKKNKTIKIKWKSIHALFYVKMQIFKTYNFPRHTHTHCVVCVETGDSLFWSKRIERIRSRFG
jgi:hypothetical protein